MTKGEMMHSDRQIQRSTDRELDLIEYEDQLVCELRGLHNLLDEANVPQSYTDAWNLQLKSLEEKVICFFSIATSIDYIEDLASIEELTKQMKTFRRNNENK